MPWSDDTRCLYCDGKLPLYRKLKKGQFCSPAHQDAYWKEQEQLAVEGLHQTHDALRAYRPAEPIENILGPLPVKPLPVKGSLPDSELSFSQPDWQAAAYDTEPAMAGLLSQQHMSRPVWTGLPSIISADPLEYEVTMRPANPQPRIFSVACEVSQTLAALAVLGHFSARQPEPGISPVLASSASLTVLDCFPVPRVPSSHELPLSGLAMGLGVALVGNDGAGSKPSHSAPRPIMTAMLPVYELASALVPVDNPIDRIDLDQFPQAETLLSLPAMQAIPAVPGKFQEPQSFEARIHAIQPNLRAALNLVGDFTLRQPSELKALPMGSPVPPAAETRLASDAIESRVDLHTISIPLHLADLAPIASSLLPLTQTLHAASMPAAVQAARAEAIDPQFTTQTACTIPPSAALSPSRATAVALPETFFPQAVDSSSAGRPVAFHAVSAAGWVSLPKWTAKGVAPEVKTRAEQVFRLNFQQKLLPRDCAVRLRSIGSVMPGHDQPLLPKANLQPVSQQPGFGSNSDLGHFATSVPAKFRSMAAGAAGFWNHAPRDLKILLFAVPIALTLAFHPSLPKVSVRAPQGGPEMSNQFKQVVDTQFASLKKSMAQRAAVGLDEDFRQGLDNWNSRSGNVAEWSFDQAGSVLPGKVALYGPSLRLTDYNLQFLGMIDQGAMSWVVRAADFDNCYVVKLVVVKPGPVPQMGLTRYAVINGKAQDRVDTPVMLSARLDSLYRVDMSVTGDRYSLTIQGQMIDAWTETRLKKGGVGFFTNNGEKSRVRWMSITHQYDMLGRLFAYLAPYDISNSSGGW
ncbi:MAG: hypothetical protein ABI995_01530 [Acidobacteriota bacterium]